VIPLHLIVAARSTNTSPTITANETTKALTTSWSTVLTGWVPAVPLVGANVSAVF